MRNVFTRGPGEKLKRHKVKLLFATAPELYTCRVRFSDTPVFTRYSTRFARPSGTDTAALRTRLRTA